MTTRKPYTRVEVNPVTRRRRCTVCRDWLPKGRFYRCSGRYLPRCKECHKAAGLAYYLRNREAVRARQQAARALVRAALQDATP